MAKKTRDWFSQKDPSTLVVQLGSFLGEDFKMTKSFSSELRKVQCLFHFEQDLNQTHLRKAMLHQFIYQTVGRTTPHKQAICTAWD